MADTTKRTDEYAGLPTWCRIEAWDLPDEDGWDDEREEFDADQDRADREED
jgi:hypothetical protein